MKKVNCFLYIAGNNHERIFLQRTALRANGSLEEVLKTYSKEPIFRISVSMISVIRLHRGT